MYKWVIYKNGLIIARGSYNVSNLARLKRRIKRNYKIANATLIYRKYDRKGKPIDKNWEFVRMVQINEPHD